MNDICKIINSLSFEEYVLIDCLKFNKQANNIYLHVLDFVALTKQGFYNIFEEIIHTVKDLTLKLFDNQIVFSINNLVFTIRYFACSFSNTKKPFKESVEQLLNLPGLDFYKRTLRVL
jgi:hypothetical protein